jgi:FkbM family methyltransferase
MSFQTTRLHHLGRAVHRSIAPRPTLARAYLSLAALMRRAPAGTFKRRLMSNMSSVEWPDVRCPAQSVVLGSDTVVRLTPHPGEFDFEALFERRLSYEREVFAYLEARMDRYDAVLEIGANVGVFTLFFAEALRRRGPAGRVFAFEPSPEAFSRLLENLRQNGVENVAALNCAAASETGFVSFFEPRGHLTNGSMDPEFAARFSRDVVKREVVAVDGAHIAALVSDYERLLLKIDVEGAESEVLQSLEPLIRARRPDILLEVHPTHDRRLDQVAVIGELYDRHKLTERGAEYQTRFVADDEHRDYILLPRARRREPSAV